MPTAVVAVVELLLLLTLSRSVAGQEQQDPTTLNGGSVMAMAGDGCVAVAIDKRFGSGPQMVNISPRHILTPHSNLVVAFTGLEGDVQSLSEELSVQISSKMARASGFGFGGTSGFRKEISPRAMSSLTSHVLYSRRRSPFYVEPLIVGLERIMTETEEFMDAGRETTSGRNEDGAEENDGASTLIGQGVDGEGDNQIEATPKSKRRVLYRPYLCAQDVIGAKSLSTSFVCSGAASKSMYGTAEAMWRPGMKSDELVRVCGKAFLSALERDCLSGYGAMVYVLTGDGGILEYDLACRND